MLNLVVLVGDTVTTTTTTILYNIVLQYTVHNKSAGRTLKTAEGVYYYTLDHHYNTVLCVLSSHLFWTSGLLVDVPPGVSQEEGSDRISHPPSFCGVCLDFSREKDSAIPFPRRP